MSKPTLYLLVGFPGAGKTTVSQQIAKHVGAEHLWADVERHNMFERPTHSETESNQVYDVLNKKTAKLLADGKSVVFDTNFNYYADRQLLRDIANRHGADTVVVWLTTPNETARARAVCEEELRNGYMVTMTDAQFDAIVTKLESPRKDEKVIKIDGTDLDRIDLKPLLKK